MKKSVKSIKKFEQLKIKNADKVKGGLNPSRTYKQRPDKYNMEYED